MFCLRYSYVLLKAPHLGTRAFEEISGEVVQTTVWVQRKSNILYYKGVYSRLLEFGSQREKEIAFLSGKQRFLASQTEYKKIDSQPVAYWISNEMLSCFGRKTVGDFAKCCKGIDTGNNDLFLRRWYEVDLGNINIMSKNGWWIPYNKGGSFRKWYGNQEYVVNWKNDGSVLSAFSGSNIRNRQYQFTEGITWSTTTGSAFSGRYSPVNFLFDSKGCMAFPYDKDTLWMIIAEMNCKPFNAFLDIITPTLDFNPGPVGKTPMVVTDIKDSNIESIAKNCVAISKQDWDSFETSWEFKKHPLMPSEGCKIYRSWDYGGRVYMPDEAEDIPWNYLLESAYQNWENECNIRFEQLRFNEEELNRIFIEIYGLQKELTPVVEEKDVTVRKADLQRDIKSLISYVVGCMFGRYSLDVEGLVYAGGEWDESKYLTYTVDKNNIIPICDDEYFADDIVGRFIRFIEVVYGEKTLDENLKFIADALGGKGQSTEVIRNYFLNDFYNDHVKMYQKRPIYWLFDSGKKNGFKALIYMHRYQPDTIARMRTDYVHEQQARYRTVIADLEHRIVSATTSERVKLNKQLIKLQAQAVEIREYEEKIHHLADQMIQIDLDDGVKVNYAKFQDVLAKIK